jgi:Asp-tRNA(Asn)/Glu-tRNA(Gln) amidotransferase A subunit family amidase
MRRILCSCTALALLCLISLHGLRAEQPSRRDSITRADVSAAEKLMDLGFSDAQNDSMLDGLRDQRANYRGLRTVSLPNNVPPALHLDILPRGFTFETVRTPFAVEPAPNVKRPANLEDAAFYSLRQLAALIRSRQVTSTELTNMYISRLKKYDPKLFCVVTLTEDLALRQAKKADEEIAAGRYRGLLHGIPYVVKDLLSTKGIPTTWGSVPYMDQMLDEDATVVRKLEEAGAVLVAKTSVGELAWGDVWFGGMTRNPWDLTQGSSGSSAGSAAATAAGLTGFSIGSETWGSIVSPSTRCGTSGLRPTYGRVSRTGAMALSWSMDKIGPICRTIEDCAIVLNAIKGSDGLDQTVIEAPFNYTGDVSLKGLRIGYVKSEFDSAKVNKVNDDSTLAVLQRLGATMVPISLPAYPINDLSIILNAEAAAAFDDLTRSGKDGLMIRQIKDAWPNVFRLSRFIPAVEYIQANRVRTLVIQRMAEIMNSVDLFVAPSNEGDSSLLTNLTGHPCVVVPNGWTVKGTPTSITFIGRLFDEGKLVGAAVTYQEATTFHLSHPKLPE